MLNVKLDGKVSYINGVCNLFHGLKSMYGVKAMIVRHWKIVDGLIYQIISSLLEMKPILFCTILITGETRETLPVFYIIYWKM